LADAACPSIACPRFPAGRMRTQALPATLALALTWASPHGLSGAQAAKPPCKYEENCACAVPGITLRWKASYCMYLNETDDLEQTGVQQCLARVEPRSLASLGPCDKNAHWKKALCRALHKGKEKRIHNCIQDKAMVPLFVEKGPGAVP
jgi:hypothetical protein